MKNDIFSTVHCGMTFGFRAPNGYFSSLQAKQEVDEMARTNVNWVVLVVTVLQEGFSATRQFRDFHLTPNDIELKEIIDYIHQKGMRVQLRPMLECFDGLGRLGVTFPQDQERMPGVFTDYCSRWFESMKQRCVYYARIAQLTGCEMFCLDSELDRMIKFQEKWKEVICAVRAVYDGAVTSCHTIHTGVIDFEKELSDPNHWFYDLDALSISDYIRCADRSGLCAEEMAQQLLPERDKLRRIAALYQKPIFFGEIGARSTAGGAMQRGSTEYSETEQANFLCAVLQVFGNEPWWKGMYWWKWEEQVARPWILNPSMGDLGWTVKGKEAQRVMAEGYLALQHRK